MTPMQVALVQQTSDVLLSVSSDVADEFYRRLFDLAPETRRFFAADLSAQKSKLTSMLASLIGTLGRPDIFASILSKAGKDHAQFGVQPRHYEPARLALIGAMELSLGSRFTPEVREAWSTLHLTIEDRMLAAAPSMRNMPAS